MPKKRTLTSNELKGLFLVRLKADRLQGEELQRRVLLAIGEPPAPEKNPAVVVVESGLLHWMAGTIARRLKRNRRTTPLISPRDVAGRLSFLIDSLARAEGHEMEEEERKTTKKMIGSVVGGLFDILKKSLTRSRKDPYRECWRWVWTVCDIADERGVLPCEVLSLDGTVDEVTRRMFTRKQFLSSTSGRGMGFMNVSVLKKAVLEPMLDAITHDLNPEERRELKRHLEAEAMPKIREVVEKQKVVFHEWIREETARIYGAT